MDADSTAQLPAVAGAAARGPSDTANGTRRRLAAAAAEAAVSLLAAALLVALSPSIDVNPLVRLGQVSGLAALGLRFALLGLLVLAAVTVLGRVRSGRFREPAERLGCAAVAGLGTGIVAGGIVVALRGTSLGLFGHVGDAGNLEDWARSIAAGHSTLPALYPPLFPHLLAWWSSLGGQPTGAAFKGLEIAGTAVLGPAAYLAWRLVFRPLPALAIGLTATLPLIMPYKPYEPFVLIVLIPVLVRAVQFLGSAPRRRALNTALAGMCFGIVFGLLFLTYSGWFLWAAPGVVAAVALRFPWRRAPGRGALFLGATAGAFVAVCGVYLFPLLGAWTSATSRDTYFYFDTFVDPAYIASWRTGLPGNVAAWPPQGPLGGVGLFTALLVLGLAVAVALGYRSPVVVTAGCCFAGAWVVRFWYASQMYADQNVRLYPRTSVIILYCLLVLVMMAGYLGLSRLREAYERARTSGNGHRGHAGVAMRGVAVLAGMLFLLGSAGSAIANTHMPSNDNSLGRLAWVAQSTRGSDGRCSTYLRDDCRTVRLQHPLHNPPAVLNPHIAGGH